MNKLPTSSLVSGGCTLVFIGAAGIWGTSEAALMLGFLLLIVAVVRSRV